MPKLLTSAALCALIFAGCDRSRSTRQISEPPQRAGSPLVPIQTKYVDERPSLSADGTRVVFASGRQSEDTKPILKIFKSEWPEGAAPAAPSRLTPTDELGAEREAVVAPNGERVLVSASSGGK